MTVTWVSHDCHMPCGAMVTDQSQELLPTTISNLTTSVMKLFSMLMHDHCQDDKEAKENKNLKNWIVVSLCPSQSQCSTN